jgi:hypothetical protein
MKEEAIFTSEGEAVKLSSPAAVDTTTYITNYVLYSFQTEILEIPVSSVAELVYFCAAPATAPTIFPIFLRINSKVFTILPKCHAF